MDRTSIPPVTVGLLEAAVLVSFHAGWLAWALFAAGLVVWVLVASVKAAAEAEQP